ncbi:hypothetical protein GWQ22_21635 [Aeromonas sp. 1HA1]|nr:hypothetical protein [Aeromonas sp. 1HA1]
MGNKKHRHWIFYTFDTQRTCVVAYTQASVAMTHAVDC